MPNSRVFALLSAFCTVLFTGCAYYPYTAADDGYYDYRGGYDDFDYRYGPHRPYYRYYRRERPRFPDRRLDDFRPRKPYPSAPTGDRN